MATSSKFNEKPISKITLYMISEDIHVWVFCLDTDKELKE